MTLPAATTVTLNGRRHYIAELEGVRYYLPSASSLTSQLDKPGVTGWLTNKHLDAAHEIAAKAASVDSEEFRTLARRKVRSWGNPEAESGTRAHEVFECLLQDRPLPDYEETSWVVEAATDMIEEFHLEVLDIDGRSTSEITVARVEDGRPLWAGTSDLLGRWQIDGVQHCGAFDLKSGASGLWPESILSTTVYTGATHWIDDQTGQLEPIPFEMDSGALFWARPEGWAFVPITAEQTGDALEVCRSLAILAAWKQTAKLMPPVNADPIVLV